jgi:hypothetical protein
VSDTTEIRFKYDGVEYVAPKSLTPAESIQLRKWTDGMLHGGVELLMALGDGDPAAWAAAIVIAQRRNGVEASWDAYMNDADIMAKVAHEDDEEDDAVPPTSLEPGCPVENAEPVSTSTPADIGSPS